MALALGMAGIFTACTDSEAIAEKGREAAVEFCECYKENSKDDCFTKLKKNYSNYENDKFIESFNETNTCGVKLIKEYVKAFDLEMGDLQEYLFLTIE